jgi:hypothetical protein
MRFRVRLSTRRVTQTALTDNERSTPLVSVIYLLCRRLHSNAIPLQAEAAPTLGSSAVCQDSASFST